MKGIEKLSEWITRHPKFIMTVALILLIPAIIGYLLTGVNYDILSYLPDDINSVQGEQILDESFHNASSAMLVIENFDDKDVVALKEKIMKIDGVTNVTWTDSVIDTTVPNSSLPSFLRKIFYSTDGKSTLMLINFESASASDETGTAIKEIRSLMNKQCFLSGMSAVLTDTKDLADSQAPIYIAFAIFLALVVMSFTMDSWVLPFVLLASLGIAVVYNMGTNLIFGEISFITKSIAAILQLGVTMDYSVFLIDRFDEEQRYTDNRSLAMGRAVAKTFTALMGSSLTTVFGFLAMCFMTLTLGFDIGIVMAKGVVFGIITVVTVLPSMVLLLYKPIYRFRHKRFVPKFNGLASFTTKHRRVFAIILLVLLVPAYLAQSNVSKYYDVVSGMPQDLDSIVALNKMKEEFNMANTHFVVIDDDVPDGKVNSMIQDIKEIDGIETVVALGEYVGAGIPKSIIPESVKSIAEKDGYQMMMINSDYSTGTDELNAQIDEMNNVISKYTDSGYLTGEGVLTKDLISIANNDFVVTSIISTVAIFILVAICFKSISIPCILVLMIELSIWINIGLSYLMGTEISFITPTVINCVQLGATVDYAILMTTRFREEIQSGKDKKTAIHDAAASSCTSIFQSALVFFSATIGVYFICDIKMIKEICELLARGSFISAIMIMLVLPPVLYILEGVINKTTYKWRVSDKESAKNENS
ncbi:MAG: efflux RND transporter permease subunit [Oscillospiraceae bacterium]|nr:efflux RND transporter permease subunit [Ruminococcus sp.]MDD7338048.1 efflux RND transporter permease subunit [Ruminococcus sp.]MDY6061160.1 efflux RND transporter permease subunit [Oscillospiraceae bacterium]